MKKFFGVMTVAGFIGYWSCRVLIEDAQRLIYLFAFLFLTGLAGDIFVRMKTRGQRQ